MKIAVECHSGYKGDERPLRFRLGEKWIEVEEVTDRWYDPGAAYFKVRGDDGDDYVLRHDARSDEWALSSYRRAL